MSLLDGLSVMPNGLGPAGGQIGVNPAIVNSIGSGVLGFNPAFQQKSPDLTDFLASSVLGISPDMVAGLTGKNTGVNGYPLTNDLSGSNNMDQSKMLFLLAALSSLFQDDQDGGAPVQAAPARTQPARTAPAQQAQPTAAQQPAPQPRAAEPQVLDVGNLKIDQAGIDSIRNAKTADEKVQAAKAALLKAAGSTTPHDVLNNAFGSNIKSGKNKDKLSEQALQNLAVSVAQSFN